MAEPVDQAQPQHHGQRPELAGGEGVAFGDCTTRGPGPILAGSAIPDGVCTNASGTCLTFVEGIRFADGAGFTEGFTFGDVFSTDGVDGGVGDTFVVVATAGGGGVTAAGANGSRGAPSPKAAPSLKVTPSPSPPW